MRSFVALAMLAALSACGNRATLEPTAGKQLPVAPYGASERPNADALLEATPQATPERSVELRKRSEERQEDPFDFPPKG